MKIVLAFDSFKGCMTADEACHSAALAIKEMMPEVEVVECPLSDGGEGLVDCVEKMCSTDMAGLPAVERVYFKAHDPLMQLTDSSYIVSADGNTAYMEMAATSGLTLVPQNKRNPLLTTTYGVGDMIADAIQRGCREIIMGIGGSATCDGGRGMVESLVDNGYMNGKGEIVNNDLSDCKFIVASDVTNPLYGRHGAAFIFGPQKGATPSQVIILDDILRNFARDVEAAGLASPDLVDYPGAGAAGGLGYALMAYLKAELRSGIDIILDIMKYNTVAEGADLIITGEGKSDEQTLMGKVPHGVLKRCIKNDTPLWLISGCVDDKDGELGKHFSLVKSINDGDSRPLDTLMQPSVAKENLSKTIRECLYSQYTI